VSQKPSNRISDFNTGQYEKIDRLKPYPPELPKKRGRPAETHVSEQIEKAITTELTNGETKASVKKRLDGKSAPSRRAIREIEKKS